MSGRRILYVQGFHPSTKAKDLAYEFEKFGKLVRCDVPARRDGQRASYAFIEFKRSEDAEDAWKAMHDKLIEGYKISVEWAKNPPSSSWRLNETSDASRGPSSRSGSPPPPPRERDRDRLRSPPRDYRRDDYDRLRDDDRDRDYDRRRDYDRARDYARERDYDRGRDDRRDRGRDYDYLPVDRQYRRRSRSPRDSAPPGVYERDRRRDDRDYSYGSPPRREYDRDDRDRRPRRDLSPRPRTPPRDYRRPERSRGPTPPSDYR